ncbi:MAG TPA: MFS transporter [Candidatus Saccharimonadales bacterium]
MKLEHNLRLLRTEAVITSALIAMPIMNPFFQSIGMNQGQIGLSQALFTLALFMLNVPTGWLADRFSRKLSNAIGDFIAVIGLLLYAFAANFVQVVSAEILLGIGLAFTQGADVGLLRAYCKKLGRDYRKESSLIAFLKPFIQVVAMIAGGFIGAYDYRLAIGLSAVPYLIGGILSLCVTEVGERRQPSNVHPIKDMWRITTFALHGHKDLAWAVLAAATAREFTHAIIWVLTPLLLLAGVPVVIVGFAWALNSLAVSMGALLSRPFASRWSEVKLFAVPAIAGLLAMAILSLHVSLWTIGLYAIFGLIRGWYEAVIAPIVQHHTPEDVQSTVFSVSSSLSQLLYIVAVVAINYAGNFGAQLTMAANALLFAPLIAVITFRLARLGKK